jgi:signal transduction histidine kinase
MSFAVSTLSPPLERLSVLTMVDASEPAAGTTRMTHAVALLTLLMLGVAVVVALVFMRANRDDVSYVRQRIADMARHEGGSSAGAAVPVRSLDQVGVLTAALNQLVGRFAEAEKGYRADLEAAAQIDTERSQFLAGLSHELRTPLNAILGFTHLLESEADGPLSGEAKEALGQIRTSGEHLKALVDDILDLSAAETGQLKLSRAAIDVLALAEEVVREARATVIDRPVRLEASGEARVHAWADPRRLRQVLTNLVANAVKATAQGTIAVTVGRDRERRMAIVSVSDSGHGIVPEVLQAIFEPYKQAGDVRTQQGGVGLGLAIARRLVLLHGGSITAESEPGRGSVFRFELPDETHVGKLPRDSLVPWADGPRGTEPARGVLPSLGADAGARPEGEES